MQNLVRARGHIIFLLALIAGFFLVRWLDTLDNDAIVDTTSGSEQVATGAGTMDAFANLTPLPLTQPRPSTAQELEYADIAWTYFVNNTNPDTGLVNSVNNYPSTTMWETGSYLVAILSAERLGLIEAQEGTDRIEAVLTSLAQLRLFEGVLPNKAYHTATLELVDYSNQPSERGLGWSALDVARIIASFALVERNHPELAPEVEALMQIWQLDQMVNDGELIGTNVVDGETRLNQEGRVGYEQYAARAMMMFGFDVYRAYNIEDNVMIREVEGLPIPVDSRMFRGATPAFVVSEPYLFDGLEFGFDARSWRFASTIYGAQEARFERTGQLTAVSEGHLNQPPYFAYSSVWGGGSEWAVLSFQAERLDSRRTISTKASFGWDALFGTEYTAQLVEAISVLGDPEQGWAEGIYEQGGTINDSITANTNAVILAALSFRTSGPLMRAP
ncbi:DUF3131 domain-containing protein [Rhodophyticola sp. CCM32]|uniref:DUF3131 domain-containing protein n=1 Tax=Rhodophyticola sp. CCM32 TaxID=2916397 RepID=UPI001EE5A462|nr:DUF3131 domain-containing protein [Rhodophyticola sp. CCM32]